jgi:hypothetical protein
LHTQANDHNNHHHHHHFHSSASSSIHRCHICNKNFLKKRDLQRHVQLKHGEVDVTNGVSDDVSNSGQDDSQMTLLSPSSSSNDDNDGDEDEDAEVVDC